MNKRKNKAELYSSDLIDQFLKEIPPEAYEKTRSKMLLAAKIDDAIKAKGWKKKDLANALNKQPSEITKWLSGVHNFTVDTLWDIEKVLGIKLINITGNETIVVQKFFFSTSKTVEKKDRSTNLYHDYDSLIPIMEKSIEYEHTKGQ